MIKLLVITGPTASGKTGLSVDAACMLNGEIVSADSMQVYSGMEIGTAAATKEEMRGIPHHMIGCADPSKDYSVVQYREAALASVRDIVSRGKLPIVVGGTGLYIDSIIYDMDYTKAGRDDNLRRELEEFAVQNGAEALHRRLDAIDPQSAARLHQNDVKRVIRALEIYYVSGLTMSGQNAGKNSRPDIEAAVIALECADREYLYQRINKRVDIMMERGLLNEVAGLLASGVPAQAQSMKAIGYRQLVPCVLDGADVAAAVEQIKRESRRYAKRQLTWMRKRECIRIDIKNKTGALLLNEALAELKEKKNGLL